MKMVLDKIVKRKHTLKETKIRPSNAPGRTFFFTYKCNLYFPTLGVESDVLGFSRKLRMNLKKKKLKKTNEKKPSERGFTDKSTKRGKVKEATRAQAWLNIKF